MPPIPEPGRTTQQPRDIRQALQQQRQDMERYMQGRADEHEAYVLLIETARLYLHAHNRVTARGSEEEPALMGELKAIQLRTTNHMTLSFQVHPGWMPMPHREKIEPSPPQQSPAGRTQSAAPTNPAPSAPQESPRDSPATAASCREALLDMLQSEQRRMTATAAQQWLLEHGLEYKLSTVQQQLTALSSRGIVNNRNDERGKGYGLPAWKNGSQEVQEYNGPRSTDLETAILDVVRLRERVSMGEILGWWPEEDEPSVRNKVQEMVQDEKLVLDEGMYSLPTE